MTLTQSKNIFTIAEIEDFDPVKIFECGQCFRWNADENGVYRGIAGGFPAEVRLIDGCVEIMSYSDSFDSFWRDYFDLETDYAKARDAICIDEYMKKASDFGKGIRILRQEPWEALCSFIISQCNNIPRIKSIVEKLCGLFGVSVELNGQEYHTFPRVGDIARLEIDDLAPLRCGYRAPYIIYAARAIDSGRIDIDRLYSYDCDTALREIKKLNGVGNKVANCFVLFGLHRLDAFPVDVWMKRALSEHYGRNFDPSVFGKYAGLAQQYMFYHARSEKLKEPIDKTRLIEL